MVRVFPNTVSDLCKRLNPAVETFRNRFLDKANPFIMIDAIYIKVRENHKVRSKALLIVLGINETGHREIIGFMLADGECETSWSNFFNHLLRKEA